MLTNIARRLKSIRRGLRAKFEEKPQNLALSSLNFFRKSKIATVALSFGALLLLKVDVAFSQSLPIESPRNSPNNLKEKIANLEGAKKAIVYLEKPFIEGVISTSEYDVEKSKCKYQSTDAKQIERLVANIRDANIVEENISEEKWQPREVVVLEFRNLDKLRFVIQPHYVNMNRLLGTVNGTTVKLNANLVESLYTWGEGVRTIKECNSWIDYYLHR